MHIRQVIVQKRKNVFFFHHQRKRKFCSDVVVIFSNVAMFNQTITIECISINVFIFKCYAKGEFERQHNNIDVIYV